MLSKNLISSVLTQIPVFLLGVISGVFSTRVLGSETKGIFSLFQANSQLFVLIFSLGIQTGIVYFISSKKIAESIVAAMSIYIFSISSLLLLLLIVIMKYFGLTETILSEGYTSNLYLICLFLMSISAFLNSICSAFFQSQSKFKTINRISISNSIINATIFAALFFVLKDQNSTAKERFSYILFTTLTSAVINSAIWVFYLNKNIKIKPDFSFNINHHLKKFISYNILIYIGMFINFFNYRLDLWIVSNYLDDKQLSYYSLAANINQIILYIAATIAAVLLPNLSSKEENEKTKTFIKISRICFTIFTIIIILAFLASSIVIPFMYGKSFIDAVLPFQILLPGILFSSITQLFSILIVSKNKNILNIIACSVGLVITIISDIILIPKLGIKGAAISTVISYTCIFITTYYFVYGQTKKATFNFFIPKKSDITFIKQLLIQSK